MTAKGLKKISRSSAPDPDVSGVMGGVLSGGNGHGVPGGVLLLDTQGVILGADPVAAELFGYGEGDLSGCEATKLLSDPENGLSHFLGFEPDSPAEGPCSHLVVCRKADGLVVMTDVRVAVLEGPKGKSYSVLVHGAEEEEEEGWEENETRVAGLAANMPGIVFQRVLQPDGTIYYPFVSVGFHDILGIAVEDIKVTKEGCLDVVHWADRDDLMKSIRTSAETLQPFTEEFRAITRQGEVCWLSGISRPQLMPEGEIIWDGVLIDITERKHAEQRLEMIMDHAYDSVVTINEQGLIESANAAAEKLFGYGVGELIGENVSILMPEPFRSEHDHYLAHYLETGEGRLVGMGPREVEGETKDGKTFPFEMALSEVRSEGKRTFIGVGRDITERKKTEAQLRETEQQLMNIAANVPGMVFQRVMRADGSLSFTYVSEGSREVLGFEPDELMKNHGLFLECLTPEDRHEFRQKLKLSSQTLDTFEDYLKVTNKAGETRWLSGWSRPRQLESGDVVWDGVKLDITDRKVAEERLTFLAYYDPVTNLPNREFFGEKFERGRKVNEQTGTGMAVLSVGLDRFGIINASMGHAVGDQVLTAAADRLKSCVHTGGTVARASGDRFLVLITGMVADVAIVEAIDTIVRGFQSPLVVNGQEFDITISIGASLFPRDGREAEELIKNADMALHRAKMQGPGSVQVFTAEMSAGASRTLSTQNRIRRAIDKGEFVAYYQPQVDLRTGKVIGMEALARWIEADTDTLIPPDDFISVAEEFGLIDALFEQVMTDACGTNVKWQKEGLATIPVAVNISGRQFHNARHLMSTIEQVMAKTRIDPAFLELELTESSAMSDPENAICVVRNFREKGISCSIDDFGTGYSSLSVLKRFPITKLKIDRSFVLDVITDPNDAAIVQAVIAMSHALKLKVVAEGVEEEEHYRFLQKMGCDQIQGYLISRPLAAEDMTRFFKEAKWPPLNTPVKPR